MAKIGKPLLLYTETIQAAGISLDGHMPPKKTIKRFIYYMKPIEDARLSGMVHYPLPEMLTLAFLAVLAGADTWSAMEMFAKTKYRWLKKVLPLKNGVPSHDTFRRVFGLIDPLAFGMATVAFLMERMQGIKKALPAQPDTLRQICVDGKEKRGSGRKHNTSEEVRNLQTLHIYDASNGICLVSAPISSKTNEIPVAQKYLEVLQLKDCVVTFDSMNTQKDTVEIIAGKGGDYVGALKGNHPSLHEDLDLFFTKEKCQAIKKHRLHFFSTSEKSHNQIEHRSFYLACDIQWFAEKNLWKKLNSFLCYELATENLITGEKTAERRYYISSLKDVTVCAQAIRGHWAVESFHWMLDVYFADDDNTTIDKNAANNFSLLSKMVLSLYKLVQPFTKKVSIRGIRQTFGWDFETQFAHLLLLFDEDFLENALRSALI